MLKILLTGLLVIITVKRVDFKAGKTMTFLEKSIIGVLDMSSRLPLALLAVDFTETCAASKAFCTADEYIKSGAASTFCLFSLTTYNYGVSHG